MNIILAPSELAVVIAALRVAAVQYSTDAATCAEFPRLAERFSTQARQATDLADALDQKYS